MWISEKLDKEQKFDLARIIVAGVLFLSGFLFENTKNLQICLFVAAYLAAGFDVVLGAFKNILRGRVFDEKFLMTAATFGALCLMDFAEAAAVMLFYQIGEFFQDYAVEHSRKSITDLMDLRAEYATILKDGKHIKAAPESVDIGDIIVIMPGERVPLDSMVISGESFLDTSAITGEPVPKHVSEGAEILGGYINNTGVITAKVLRPFGDSAASRILKLVEETSEKKAKTEHFITKFAKVYTPFVVIAAVILALLPPLLTDYNFAVWVVRALIFLVISCPCALVVSIPLGFFAGIGAASKKGVLVKGGNCLEALADAETMVFDKTGTLTKGTFSVLRVVPCGGYGENDVLEAAAYAEGYSAHPIARSIRKCYGEDINLSEICDAEETAGYGISISREGEKIIAGNDKMMQKHGIKFSPLDSSGTVVYVARGGEFLGCIEIGDEIKPDSRTAIKMLRKLGIRRTVILTGDNEKSGEAAAAKVGADEVYTRLLPEDKVDKLKGLLEDKKAEKTLAFVGDGMNDAPVLALADVGIAMGALGSDAAIEAADVVLMTDEPSKIAAAVYIAKKTVRLVIENIVFAVGTKALILILGALGLVSMWAAVIADVGVALLAILNSLRILK